MNTDNTPHSQSILHKILANKPSASLHEIRAAHPIFQQMSLDHLGLRLSRAVERAADSRAK